MFVMGGIAHYYADFLNKLQEKNVEVVLVAPNKSSATVGKGVKTVENGLNFKTIRLDEKISYYQKAYYPDLSSVLETEKPDVAIFAWPYFLQYFFVRKLRQTMRKHAIKYVIREIPFQTPQFGKARKYYKENPVHDENMRVLSKGIFFYVRALMVMHVRRYCYKHCDASLNYSTIAHNILPSYGISKENIFVTYNTTNNEVLWAEREKVKQREPLLPINSERIIHIGRLVKWKRVDLLLDAFTLVVNKYPNAELLVVGEGQEKDNLMQQSIKLNIANNVRFVGSTYDSHTLGQYMNESAIYVLAGMGGLSINDAMTYGLPIICSVCDGTEVDLVEDQHNGLYFDENNKQSLAEKIITLLKSPELCKQMGENSENIIRNKINIETVLNRYLSAFKTIVKRQQKTVHMDNNENQRT